MLNTLTLTNFGKHESLTLTFGPGLNVIRAPNESGKSTLYNAIKYAFWGTRALPLSLAETVTWGKAEGSLRDSLSFSVAGADYNITRSKSGAELHGPGVVVTGQAEVTAFVSRLLKANQAVGMATLMASQGDLAQGLENSTASLIDKLSDMTLIEYLVDKVQVNLPTGSTKLVDAQIERYEALEPPIADFAELEASVIAASESLAEQHAALASFESELQTAQQLALDAKVRLAAEGTRLRNIQQLELRAAKLEAVPQVTELTELDIPELEILAEEEGRLSFEFKAWEDWLCQLPKKLPERLPFAPAEVQRMLQEGQTRYAQLRDQESKLHRALGGALARRVTDKSCSICGMDTSEIPSVVAAQVAIEAECLELRAQLEASAAESSKLLKQNAQYAEALAAHEHLSRLIPESRITRQDCTPMEFTLEGAPQKPVTNYRLNLKMARDAAASQREALHAWRNAQAELALVQGNLASLQAPQSRPGDEGLVKAAEQLLSQRDAQHAVLKAVALKAQEASDALAAAKSRFAAQCAAHEAAMVARDDLLLQRKVLQTNNTLVKKLRDARPIISRQLWSTLTGGISHVFSQMRGVPSVVTRGPEGWLVDGKPAEAYSGSTKDVLSLAIRVLLQKTFMPSTDFTLLDEPAAGCDAQREVDMLAALVRADLNQVILVTHSDLADTLANNVITL